MKTAIIDCRNFNQFLAGHHKEACHIAAHQLFERMHELPSKNTAIDLISDAKNLKAAEAFFKDKQYTVNSLQIWNEAFVTRLKSDALYTEGTSSKRLWQPSAIVQTLINALSNNKQAKALDIASGAGRDAIFLALQGFDVTAIDYNPDAIKRCKSLATYNHVEISTIERDIEKSGERLSFISDDSFDIITVCRYLHRPLFNDIKRILKPGGIIAYHTFMQGCEKIGRPKNPNFLLQENELSDLFSGYRIIEDKKEILEDGRPTSFFIAQKP